jgi:hypothetical protein
MRYIRAFFKALSLTLQGKTIEAPALRYPKLQAWIAIGLDLTKTVFRVSEQLGLNEEARKNLILHLDSRDWSMELILSSLYYHLTMEYPSLLTTNVEHNITTLYALNLDDLYRVSQLAESQTLQAELRQAVQALTEHLQQIPPSNDLLIL